MSVGILSPDEIRDELLPDGGRHGLHRPSGADVNDIIGFSSVDLPLGTEYWVMLGELPERKRSERSGSPALVCAQRAANPHGKHRSREGARVLGES